MKKDTNSISKKLVFLSLFFSITSCSPKFLLKPDNIVEEMAETALYHYTGKDVDLSPGTEERAKPCKFTKSPTVK